MAQRIYTIFTMHTVKSIDFVHTKKQENRKIHFWKKKKTHVLMLET